VTRTLACCVAFPLAFASLTAAMGHAADVVEIQLRGHYFAEPATVQITVVVEPDEQNRMLRIEADGDRFYRASELTLAGTEDPRVHSLVFRNLPAGSYELRAAVFSTTALRGRTSQEVVVTGRGGR
jgi:hypothetical protein